MDRADIEKWLWNNFYRQLNYNLWQNCECDPSYKPINTYIYILSDDYAMKYEYDHGWKYNSTMEYNEYEVEDGKLCSIVK